MILLGWLLIPWNAKYTMEMCLVQIKIASQNSPSSKKVTSLSSILTSKKIYVAHCMVLAQKLVARIRNWSTGLLSFAGRLELVKNVLFCISNFLLQSIPSLRKLLKLLNQFVACSYGLEARKFIIKHQLHGRKLTDKKSRERWTSSLLISGELYTFWKCRGISVRNQTTCG